ncbi:MAG: 2Fe-2S iron-sulfur cluster-binding protein [bacterium]
MEKPMVTILMVEDDPIHAQLMKKEIHAFDESFVIEHINTAEQCFDRLGKSAGYDLIIIDNDLPEMEGRQALRQIRQTYRFRKPVIMLVSLRNEGIAEDVVRMGATDCIIKTEDYTSRLLVAIKDYLKKHPSMEERVVLEYRPQEELIEFSIDGERVVGKKGETLIEVADRYGIKIPRLCYHQSVSTVGVCRLCIVEVTRGNRTRRVPSCVYPVQEGIAVKTTSEKIEKYRRMILELLMARCPESELIRDMAREMGLEKSRFSPRHDPDKCILCGLCIRVCEEVIGANAICFSERGVRRRIGTPFMELSDTCTGCGECAKICPTDAITLEYIDNNIMKRRKARIAIKCDGCAEYSTRACVSNCPTGALQVMTIQKFLSKNKGSINVELRELLKYSLGEAEEKNA